MVKYLIRGYGTSRAANRSQRTSEARSFSFYRSQHELICVFKKDETPHLNTFELGQHGRTRSN